MNNDKSRELDEILSELNETLRTEPGVDEKEKEQPLPEETVEVEASVGEIEAAEGEVIPKRNKPVKKKKESKYSRRQKVTAVIGLVITIFTIIGIVASVMFIWKSSSELINNTAQKQEFATDIFPLVIIDTPEFDSPKDLDNSVIISAAIWALVTDKNANLAQYPTDDLGIMSVPEVDIEKYVRKLFGSNVAVTHGSIDTSTLQILYSADEKSYQIESAPKYITYSPRVETIKRDGNVYTLRVNYVLPDITWTLNKQYDEKISKVMEYKLTKLSDGTFQIDSVKFVELANTDKPAASGDKTASTQSDDPFTSGEQTENPSSAETQSQETASQAADEGE